MAVGVIRNGSVLYERYFGYAWGVAAGPQTPISASTTFDLAFESKQFTACAVALLASRNQVDLSAPVRQYLPEMQDRTVTVRQLLYHTNGFPSDFYTIYVRNEAAPAVLARIATSRPSVVHGTRFAYNNLGYFLLTQIVERISRQTFSRFCRENIFDRLRMRNTRWDEDFAAGDPAQKAINYEGSGDPFRFEPQYWVRRGVVGQSGLLTTLRDLARWDANFYSNQLGNGTVDLH